MLTTADRRADREEDVVVCHGRGCGAAAVRARRRGAGVPLEGSVGLFKTL
jgi:hypothetical protein